MNIFVNCTEQSLTNTIKATLNKPKPCTYISVHLYPITEL